MKKENAMSKMLLGTVLNLFILVTLFTPSFAQSQTDMQDEECAKFKRADAELNKSYKKILTEYKENKVFIEKLKKAQKAWLVYRDAHVESVYPEEDKSYYGSVYGMCNCGVKQELTEQRTKMLKQWVQGVKEGDVCAGSVKFKE